MFLKLIIIDKNDSLIAIIVFHVEIRILSVFFKR